MIRDEAIACMNDWGKEELPFLFVTSFTGEEAEIVPLDLAAKKGLWFDIEGLSNYPYSALTPPTTWDLFPVPAGFNHYQKAFNFVIGQIKSGNSYLCNLTQATPMWMEATLEQIFSYSQAKYKLWWEGRFVCFSPETFVKIEDGRISSFPMKGTINAAIPHAREKILQNPKELYEHNTIVDLIRNDLSAVAKKVEVVNFRYIDTIQTVSGTNLLQVSSHIEGLLGPEYPANLGDLIFGMLPAGSISGAPKVKTLEIIKAAEEYDRGFFTGIVGYFDGKNLNSGVMIRFIERRQDDYVFKSGGGITALSNPQEEYEEMLAKIYLPISAHSPSKT